jgi:hypothetical protein
MKNKLSPIKLWVLAALSAITAGANELKDLVLTGGKSPALKFVFAKGQTAEDYPLYFQKIDAASQAITICFLETPSSLPLGKMALPDNAPIQGLALKKVTTPSGKNFLGVEIVLPALPPGELSLSPGNGGTLRAKLPATATPTGKLSWSASKSAATLPKPQETPAEPAAAPPSESVTETSAPKAPVPPEPVAVETPVAPPAAPAVAAPAAPDQPSVVEPGMISDIAVVVGATQQDLLVIGEGLGALSFTRNVQDTLAYDLKISGAKFALASKAFTPPALSIFASIKIRQIKDTLALAIRLRRPALAQAGAAGQQIAVTVPQGGDAQLKWLASAGKTVAATGLPETGPSAHDEGAKLDQGKGGLSSSVVFLPSGFGKPMLIMRDSAALREKAQPRAKPIKHVPAGAQILKLESEGQFLRVVSENDTGYIAKADALYSDELTAKDEAKLQRLIAARAIAVEKALEKQRRKEAEIAAQATAAEKAAQAEQAAQAAQAAEAAAQAEKVAQETAQAAQAAAAESTTRAEAAKTPAPKEPVAAAAPQPEATPKSESGAAPLHIATQDEQKIGQAPDAAMLQRLEQERLAAEKDKQKAAEGPITYNSFGRRDPFVPVEQGNTDNGIDIDQMKVVGIVWHLSDPMAVLQHVKESSVSFTVKQGDPVHNGRVSRITRDAVTFDITEYGISRSYSLKLVSMQERAKK